MIHIRLAEAGDQKSLADVFSSQVGPSGNTTVQNLWEVWSHDPDGQPLLAQDASGKIVGFTHLAIHRGREGWIEDLMVHREHQGQGVATALINRCREIINSLGGHRLGLDVFSTNERAISLYHRLGFEAEYGYVRMDGTITPDVVEWATGFLRQHHEIVVGSYHPADRSALSELLNVDQRVVQSHHKAYVLDQSDVEDGFVRTGHMLVARTDAMVQPLGVALFQVERVWRDGDRVIPPASLLVSRYPDLPSILIICAIVITRASLIGSMVGHIRECLVAQMLRYAADSDIRVLRAYPQVRDVFTIDCLRRNGYSLPVWERDPEHYFLVMSHRRTRTHRP